MNYKRNTTAFGAQKKDGQARPFVNAALTGVFPPPPCVGRPPPPPPPPPPPRGGGGAGGPLARLSI
ncbi:MAG: hypothetical protein IPP85_04785 [Propionivibrio sp.]|nr:hypothetical protein [Propionivibrio sp.]